MSEHLDEIRRQYPGQLVLGVEDVAKVLGRAKQTVYNQAAKGVFPVRMIKQKGDKGGWGCSIVDLGRYLDTGEPYTPPTPAEKPQRGRKPKPLLHIKEFWGQVLFLMRKDDAEKEKEGLLEPFHNLSEQTKTSL